MPQLFDMLMIEIIEESTKRLESVSRRMNFSALGSMFLDADMWCFVAHAKKILINAKHAYNISLCKSSVSLARLPQISLLMNVDDLEDVLDLIATSKMKVSWDLKIEDVKSFLNLRVSEES